jgi:outer membrane protein, heavy metal efflux system
MRLRKLLFRSIFILAVSLALTALSSFPALATEEEVTLSQALELFYKNNYDVLISKYEIDKAYGDYIGSRLLPNPNLSFNYSFIGFNGFPKATDNTQTVTRIDQLIELGGKRELRAGASSEALEAVKLSQKDTVRTLLIGFYTLFFNINTDLLNTELARDELKRFDKTLMIGEKRFQSGFLSLVDYTKLKLAGIDLENNLFSLEAQFRNDVEQFSMLLGMASPVKPALQISEEFNEQTEKDLLQQAYQYRFDLLSIERQLKASALNQQLAKAQRIPDITLGAEFDTIGPKNDPGAGFGFSIPLPLFNRNQGEIAKKKAEYHQLEIQKDRVKRQILSDVRQSVNNFEASKKVFVAYGIRKKDMEELMEKTEKAFSLGGLTVLDLLDTEKTYRNFMTKYNQSLVQANLNGNLLKVYTGELR